MPDCRQYVQWSQMCSRVTVNQVTKSASTPLLRFSRAEWLRHIPLRLTCQVVNSQLNLTPTSDTSTVIVCPRIDNSTCIPRVMARSIIIEAKTSRQNVPKVATLECKTHGGTPAHQKPHRRITVKITEPKHQPPHHHHRAYNRRNASRIR